MPLLRFPRIDDTAGFVLVRIDPTSAANPTLDARILATEGTAPFILNLKQSQVEKLRVTKAAGTPAEWQQILTAVLLQQDVPPGIDVGAVVEEGQAIEIVFRKSFSGITQRLGTLRLACDEEQEIELFDWCGDSVQHASNVAAQLRTELAKSQKLFGEVQELLKAKASSETELLEKFSQLLNTKKAKIRDLEMQMGVSGFEAPARAEAPSAAARKEESPVVKTKKAGASRAGKRKAAAPEPEEETTDDETTEDEKAGEEGLTTEDEDDGL